MIFLDYIKSVPIKCNKLEYLKTIIILRIRDADNLYEKPILV